jgi:hypothetical protein
VNRIGRYLFRVPLRAEREFQLGREAFCGAAPRVDSVECCNEEMKDFCDHDTPILAGLVGHLRGERLIFLRNFLRVRDGKNSGKKKIYCVVVGEYRKETKRPSRVGRLQRLPHDRWGKFWGLIALMAVTGNEKWADDGRNAAWGARTSVAGSLFTFLGAGGHEAGEVAEGILVAEHRGQEHRFGVAFAETHVEQF